MKPTPPDWPRLSVALFYDDPRRAIGWLCEAFGFTVRMVIDGPGGQVAHSELDYGEARVMVAGAGQAYCGTDPWRERLASPAMAGRKLTANLFVYVDDADAHCAAARAAGAEIVSEPQTVDYGAEHWSDRNYAAYDCEGHLWWFAQRIATKGKPA